MNRTLPRHDVVIRVALLLLLVPICSACVSRTVEMPVEIAGKQRVLKAKFVRGLTNEKLGKLRVVYDGMELEIEAMESDQTSAIKAIGEVAIDAFKTAKGP